MPSGPRLQFCSYEELNGRPNIVVDGSPTGGTVLCLTHWPHIESPARYRGDLSAEMAFRYAEDRRGGGDATLVAVTAPPNPKEIAALTRIGSAFGPKLAVLVYPVEPATLPTEHQGQLEGKATVARQSLLRAGWEVVVISPAQRLKDVWVHDRASRTSSQRLIGSSQ